MPGKLLSPHLPEIVTQTLEDAFWQPGYFLATTGHDISRDGSACNSATTPSE